MTTTHGEKQVARARALLSRWNGGDAELWQHRRSHQGVVLRLSADERDGCLLLYLGDVSRYRGPLRWRGADIEVTWETSPATGDDFFAVRDSGVDCEVRCAVLEAKEMADRYPKP